MVTEELDSVDPGAPVLWSDDGPFYTKPESGGLMLCACDESVVEPDGCEVDESILAELADRARRFLPDYEDVSPAHLWAGMRTFAEDDGFAVGPDPDVAGLSWVAGLGGHGITTSAAVGRLAARLVLGLEVEDRIARAVAPERLRRLHA